MNRSLLIGFVILLAGVAARAAEVLPHDILAQGDNERFWIARVETAPTLHTTIYYRLLGDDRKWQTLAVIPARVVSLATQNSLGAALLDDGTWMLLYPDSGPFTAGGLPAPARMVALAGGPREWWAIGVVPHGIAGLSPSAGTQPSPATSPAATAPAATTGPALSARLASTQPHTQPAEGRLVLFSFTKNNWSPQSELPDVAPDAPSVSMAFVEDVPYVADRSPGGALRVRHLQSRAWVTDGSLSDLPALVGFQLLGNSQLPRLGVQMSSGPDRLYVFHNGVQAIDLPAMAGSIPSERALAIATGPLRIVAQVKDQVWVQDFDLKTGKPDQAPYALSLPRSSALHDLGVWVGMIVGIALVVAAMGSLRQREGMKELAPKLEQIRLAPLGRRFAAGLIDAAPMILAVIAALVRFRNVQIIPEQSRAVLVLIIYWSAGIFYIIYITVIESLAGRSLGKLLMGLRVVGLDGEPANPGALTTRNILRVIEVGLLFLPLLLVPLSPRRQRAGDVAAGTLVTTAEIDVPSAQDAPETASSRNDKP